MKANIKDEQSGPKKDSGKLATIKKSEKAGDLKISEAKKSVIGQAIINATKQTPAVASSASNENLFSHFTNPQKAFTPSTSTFSSVAFSKDREFLVTPFKFCPQPFVFGQQTLVPGSLQIKQESLTTVKPSIHNSLAIPPKINAPQTATSVSMKENTALKDSFTNQQSSTTVRLSMHNSLVVPDIMNSVQTKASAQAMTTTFNDSLNNLQSSTSVKPLSNLQSSTPVRLLSKLQSSTPVRASTQNSLSQTVVGTQPVKEKTFIFKDSLSDLLSLSSVQPSMKNSSVVPDIMNSVQTKAGAQAMTTTFNDSSNNLQSSTSVKPLSNLQSSTPVRQLSKLQSLTPVTASTQNSLSQTIGDTQPVKEKTIILNDSLSNLLSSSSVQPAMQNSLVSNTTNLPQSLSDVQPMGENGTFDDLLQVQEPLNTKTPSMQNNSCDNGVNSEQSVFEKQSVEENTKQVAVPPVQPSVENVNSGKSLHVQRFSVPLSVPVQNSHNNIQKAYDILKKLQYSLQYSISTQTQVSNTTLSVSKDNNILPSQNSSTKLFNKTLQQNSSTKGVKRKAEKTKNVVKNSGSLGNSGNSGSLGSSGNSGYSGKKKKNKKKFVQPQIVKKNTYNSQNNFTEMKNSNALTCAIVEEQYPNMPPLTNVHLGIIRNVIKERIDNIPLGVFVPKFMNAFIKDGVILVECADNNSKDWLKHAITNYNPQEGVYLKVIPPDAINEYYPASIFVHDEENAIDVLRRLQKQNSDVNVQNWQYLSMIIVKESTPGITINVGIPATSVAQLKEKNFKLFHAMDQVMVVMKCAIPF